MSNKKRLWKVKYQVTNTRYHLNEIKTDYICTTGSGLGDVYNAIKERHSSDDDLKIIQALYLGECYVWN